MASMTASGGGVRLPTWSAVVFALPVAAAAVLLDWRLVTPLAVALPLATVALVEPREHAPPHPGTRPAAWTSVFHGYRWLSATWAALIALSTIGLLSPNRSATAAASGSLSLDNLTELVATGMAVLVIASAVRHGWSLRIPRVAGLFVLFAAWAWASALWSSVLLFTFGRGMQYAAIALLTAYCAARAGDEPGFTDRLMRGLLRPLTAYVLLVAVLWVVEIGGSDPRVNWRGNSPNTVGLFVLLPILGLLAHRARRRITRPVPWWLVVAVLAAVFYWTRTRTFAGAALVAGAAMWLAHARRRQQLLAVGLGAGLVVTALVSVFAWDEVVGLMYRGESTARIKGLAGRLELWRYVFDNPAGSEVWGVGLGASRGRLPQDWAPDNAHNAWVDLHQNLGVVGVGLMAAVVITVVVLVVRTGSVHAAWMMGMVLVATTTGTSINQPDWSACLLGLSIVAVSDRSVRERDGPAEWWRSLRSGSEPVAAPTG